MTRWPSPPLPSPTALRLVRTGGGPSSAAPPFGLKGWSDADDADVALLLARPRNPDVPTLAEIAAQVPLATTLRPGTLLVVLGDFEAGTGLLGRLLGGNAKAPRVLRCTALLAQGYTRLGAATDPSSRQELTWGVYAPPSTDPRD